MTTIGQYQVVNKNLDGKDQLNFSNKNLIFLQVFYLLIIDYSHHEKVKLKPPIPRMSSKTPTKNQD